MAWIDLDGVELRLGNAELAEGISDDTGGSLAQISACLDKFGGAVLGEELADGAGELGLVVDLGEINLVGVVRRDFNAPRRVNGV